MSCSVLQEEGEVWEESRWNRGGETEEEGRVNQVAGLGELKT